MPSPLDNPYFKAALEQAQQDRDIAARQQQDYNNRLLQLDKSKLDALSQVESSLSALPEQVRGGAGIKWEADVARKRIERDAALAKVALARGEKGNDEELGIIKTKYPESDFRKFEDTDTYKQANERFNQISEKFRVADILNQQLKTVGEELVKAREVEAMGDKAAAAKYRENAANYGVVQLSQNLASAVVQNVQGQAEFMRAAESLLNPGLVLVQGGGLKQTFGAAFSKFSSAFNNPKTTPEEKDNIISTVGQMVSDSLVADPEKWYSTAQRANKDIQSEKERLFKDQIVGRVGIHHADMMGARRPIIYDPLADYMAAKAPPKEEQRGFAQVERSPLLTLTTGAGTSMAIEPKATPSGTMQSGTTSSGTMQSGTMQPGTISSGAVQSGTVQPGTISSGTTQSGTVSSGTMMPTSRPGSKFRILNPR